MSVECPACHGATGNAGIGCGPEGCKVMVIPCRYCSALGTVSKERAEEIDRKITEGDGLREDRKKRGLSLREEARRLGISAAKLSDREFGR